MADTVLFVEDDATIRFAVSRHLERNGFRVVQAESCSQARERFRECLPQAVLTDFRLPDGEALDLIADFRRDQPFVPIVVLTGYGSIELAVLAVKNGAHNFLTKPVDMDKLVAELRNACGTSRRAKSGRRVSTVIFRDGQARTLDREIERLKDVDCSLLILGETGTGKTVLARRIHEASKRRDKAFVDLNCAGLARDLVEAELFGHERGAFTSAHMAKPGMFELADHGTLFLDEIGDVDLAVQPKLLKVIEEKRFRRMGGVREHNVDVRIIAATHRDLREAVRAGAFRADLYYRLGTIAITLPALRDRRDEIPAVARELVDAVARKLHRPSPELSPEAVDALMDHDWPGNVRELKNVLERAVHLSPSRTLEVDDLRIDAATGAGDSTPSSRTLREVERVQIEQALAAHGHVGEAARSLGISRSSMYQKVKDYGLLPTSRSSAPKLKVGTGGSRDDK
jgi:DNA-binding NtrC family response regulator